MVFPFSYQITQRQRSQNGVAHQGPHSVTVHIAIGKPQKHSDPSGEVTLYPIAQGLALFLQKLWGQSSVF